MIHIEFFAFFLIVCFAVTVKWLAVKTASEMTYTVSGGALNSILNPIQIWRMRSECTIEVGVDESVKLVCSRRSWIRKYVTSVLMILQSRLSRWRPNNVSESGYLCPSLHCAGRVPRRGSSDSKAAVDKDRPSVCACNWTITGGRQVQAHHIVYNGFYGSKVTSVHAQWWWVSEWAVSSRHISTI